MNTDFEARIASDLRDASRRITLPGGDPGRAMARGRRRLRRQQAGAAAAAFAAGAALVSGLLVARTHGSPHTTVRLDPTLAGPAHGPAGGAPLSWRVAPATSGLYAVTALSDGSGSLYAVSTSPGVSGGNVPSVLYRSADGKTWTPVHVANQPAAGIADVSATGNSLYTVATGPATASVAGGEAVTVGDSTDGGSNFSRVDLPLDLTSSTGALTVRYVGPHVAAGPHGVVVAVAASVNLDLSQVDPAAGPAPAWTTSAAGVEVLGAERAGACGAGESTTPPGPLDAPPTTTASAAAGPVRSASCYDSTGKVVRSIPVQGAYPVTATIPWSHLGVSAQAARAIQAQPLVFYSSDGKNFQQVQLPPVTDSGMDLVAGPQGFALLTDGGVTLSADGRAWSTPVALPGGFTSSASAGFVAGRLLVFGTAAHGPEVISPDANGWDSTPLATTPDSVAFGPLGVAVAGVMTQPADGSGPPAWAVSFSTDGTTWTTQPLGALVGGPVGQAVAAVSASNVVVTVTRPPLNAAGGSPASQVAVIGTPAG